MIEESYANHPNSTLPALLTYEGQIITQREDMLCLTDMWKAAGSPENGNPYEWSRKEGAPFFEAVSLSYNTPVERIIIAKRGKGGSTFAHWQVGLAYAKYLSPAFHMWCNTVVRERMEGKIGATITPELIETIRRTDGICRMLAHKMTEMEKGFVAFSGGTIERLVKAELASHTLIMRRGQTAGQIWKANGLPSIKSITTWFGNRLTKMGCRIEGHGRAEMGLSTARLFDPDRANAWLENGGRTVVEAKIAERRGQRSLKLIVMK